MPPPPLPPPRKCKVVEDNSTGEVFYVETSKQAKRRHQKSGGGQFRPTKGQINAADIWNKQEEKIKRDRERERKRKIVLARQAEKEAQARARQHELLRKGKLSVEDLWGKVSASQNRLHRFFPAANQTKAKVSVESEDEDDSDLSLEGYDSESEPDNQSISENDNHSPSTRNLVDPRERLAQGQNPPLLACALVENRGQIKSIEQHIAPMAGTYRASVPTASQMVMPPPPGKRLLESIFDDNIDQSEFEILDENENEDTDQTFIGDDAESLERTPLSELSTSDVNARATEKPDPEELLAKSQSSILRPLSTQVITETLAGLCSQDLEDDFDEIDKENQSPQQEQKNNPGDATATKTVDCNQQLSKLLVECHSSPTRPASPTLTQYSDLSNLFDCIDGADDETFDDSIDDETLISLAATQQLRQDLLNSSKPKSTLRDAFTMQSGFANLSESASFAIGHSHSTKPKVHDSFAVHELDDDDLLQCVEQFEEIDEQVNIKRGIPNTLQTSRKKRRTLPWEKNPIQMSPPEQDNLTPSPISPTHED